MSALEWPSHSPEETRSLGELLGQRAWSGEVLLLVGALGTGKTCLVQGLARGLGVREPVASPSFVLVREYRGRLALYHIDLYRMGETVEIADLGLEDYLSAGGVCAVEWAEKGWPLFPAEHLKIEFAFLSETERRLTLLPSGEPYRALVAELSALVKRV